MSMADNAARLHGLIARLGDGPRKEAELRGPLGMSHAVFVEARKLAVASGLIAVVSPGGNRSAVYRALRQAAAQPAGAAGFDGASPRQGRRPGGKALVSEVMDMPRVTGVYAGVDDWEAALMEALGSCIDVDYDGSEAVVYAHGYGQRASYRLDDTDEGLVVS